MKFSARKYIHGKEHYYFYSKFSNHTLSEMIKDIELSQYRLNEAADKFANSLINFIDVFETNTCLVRETEKKDMRKYLQSLISDYKDFNEFINIVWKDRLKTVRDIRKKLNSKNEQ